MRNKNCMRTRHRKQWPTNGANIEILKLIKTQQHYLQQNVNLKLIPKFTWKEWKRRSVLAWQRGPSSASLVHLELSQLRKNFQHHSHNNLINIIKNKTPNWSQDWKFKVFFINIRCHTSPCLEVFIQNVCNWKY